MLTINQLDSLIKNQIINFKTNTITNSLIRMSLFEEDKNNIVPIIRMDSLWYQYNEPLNIINGMDSLYYYFEVSKVSNEKDLIYKYINENIKIFREKNQIILKNFEMPLIGGDSIIVPQHTSVVEIPGPAGCG